MLGGGGGMRSGSTTLDAGRRGAAERWGCMDGAADPVGGGHRGGTDRVWTATLLKPCLHCTAHQFPSGNVLLPPPPL